MGFPAVGGARAPPDPPLDPPLRESATARDRDGARSAAARVRGTLRWCVSAVVRGAVAAPMGAATGRVTLGSDDCRWSQRACGRAFLFFLFD